MGAGTSGRLGILDASEIPPTFGVSPELVQGIIAGGAKAVFQAQEGAEDSQTAGATAIRERGIKSGDVVVGIATSGRTPFVIGALKEATKLKAKTVILTCNPDWESSEVKPTIEVHIPTGPEIISGSTRLKGGTVTKLVLNMFSSIAMIQSGKVHNNLMINVTATNEKLRARCVRLVRELSGVSCEKALASLQKHDWHVLKAIKG